MENTLKLSILLQKKDLSQHSLDLIKWCVAHKKIELVCLIWIPDKSKSFMDFDETIYSDLQAPVPKISLIPMAN